MTRPPIATRSGQPAYLNAPPRTTQTMCDQERGQAQVDAEPPTASTDWFTWIGCFLIGVMFMLAVLGFFQPVMVSM